MSRTNTTGFVVVSASIAGLKSARPQRYTNCVNAALVAKAKGLQVVAMTGAGGGKLAAVADAAIKVPETDTYRIQELHLPVYHAFCAQLEEMLF